jgi:hypothetical protein
MDDFGICHTEGCDAPAIVELNGSSLCLRHFEEGLTHVRKLAEALRRKPPVPPGRGICGVTHETGAYQRNAGHGGAHSYVTWPKRREPAP